MSDHTPSTCPVCKMAEHKLSCPEREDGQMKFSTTLPARAPSMPPLPAPIRRRGQQMGADGDCTAFFDCYDNSQMHAYAQAVADERVRAALELAYDAMFGIAGCKVTRFNAQTAIRELAARQVPGAVFSTLSLGSRESSGT